MVEYKKVPVRVDARHYRGREYSAGVKPLRFMDEEQHWWDVTVESWYNGHATKAGGIGICFECRVDAGGEVQLWYDFYTREWFIEGGPVDDTCPF